LVEKSDGSIEQPKMDLVGIRTMEFCRRWGIVPLVEASPYDRTIRQDNVYVTSLCGYELGREPFPSSNDNRPPPQSPSRRERCPQDMFDPILRAWVETFPAVTLSYRHELVAFTQRAGGVEAEVIDHGDGRRETIEADFLVGCDGASSRVASALGIPFAGTPVLTNTTNIIFRAPQLLQLHGKGEAYRFIIVGPEGTWATIVAINGGDRWRMSIVRSPDGGLSRDEIAAAIRRAVGTDFDFEILSVTNWKRRELVAERYGEGRVFIAGDAAHVMSPTGGFGMNTGIGDAVDLAWKLDAVLAGWGGPHLLDSYTRERRPVAERNARESSDNLARMLSPEPMPLLCEDSPEGARLRAEFGAAFSATMRHEWFTLGIHLGYRYDDSPICRPDGTAAPPLEVARYEQTAYPGARAPHVALPDGRSTLDWFGDGFTLLQLGRGARPEPLAEAARSRGVPLRVVACDLPAVRAAYGADLVLVRPDGHVAWRGDAPPPDPLALVDRVRGAESRTPPVNA
jgi:2-polyprenyl-6-methoxyphenol hydroxylase-like FAD-dependent oxidoreductase